MNKNIMLNSSLLGEIVHPRPNQNFILWFKQHLASGAIFILPEIADYELRRELLHRDFAKSIERLNELKEQLNYMPLTTEIMLKAAEFWADARKRNVLNADLKELNGDVILAAQAEKAEAIIATENVGHLSLFAEAKDWREIMPL